VTASPTPVGGPAAAPAAAGAARVDFASRVARAAGYGALLLLFAAAFEFTCRLEDWLRYRMPWWTPITSQDDLVVFDKDGGHGRPGARYQKWVMNNLGMRGPDAEVAKSPGTLRVVTVGASETFGLYESPNREFPRQLEDTLNARLARGACAGCGVTRFEVLNAAAAGMSLPTVAQDIATRVRALHPDVIVVYPSPAQYLELEPPRPARPDSTGRRSRLSPARAFRPRALDRLRNQLKLLLPEVITTALRRREIAAAVRGQPPGWQYTAIPADRLDRYESDLRMAAGVIRSVGAEPILATHANAFAGGRENPTLLSAWQRFYPRATGPTILAFDSAARIVTERVARDSSTRLVDLMGTLAAAPDSAFKDFVHFSDVGSSAVAADLGDAVLALARARQP
jgi:hypothetical protein